MGKRKAIVKPTVHAKFYQEKKGKFSYSYWLGNGEQFNPWYNDDNDSVDDNHVDWKKKFLQVTRKIWLITNHIAPFE